MEKDQLLNVRQSLETFFYRIRFNIGLNHALESGVFKSFRSELKKSLRNQILYFAKIEKVNSIIGLRKAVKELTDQDLLINLGKMWIPIFDILSQEDAKKFLIWSANEGGQIAVNKLDPSVEFRLKNEKIVSMIEQRAIDFSKIIDYTTQSWIARTVEEGISMGMNSIDIAKTLRDQSTNVSYFRSDTIAEYELALQIGEMQNEVFKRSGVTHHRWITTRDERTCLECASNEEAGEVEIGDEFPSGVIYTPGHISCRCFIAPVSLHKEIWTGN